jgi:hypothetical protein
MNPRADEREHKGNVAGATNALFSSFADDPVVTVSGDASPELIQFASARIADAVKWYPLLQGLGS